MPVLKQILPEKGSTGTDTCREPEVVSDLAPPPYRSPYGGTGGFGRPYESLFPCDAARVVPFKYMIARSLATRYHKSLPLGFNTIHLVTNEEVELFTQLHKATNRYIYGMLDADETLDLCAKLEVHILRPADELHIPRCKPVSFNESFYQTDLSHSHRHLVLLETT